MFTHILIPVDGSATAKHAAKAAIELAISLKAKLTLINVVNVYAYVSLGAEFAAGQAMYLSDAIAGANLTIASVRADIEAAGVPCESRVVESNAVWRGIVETADSMGADLIVMGTHGRNMIDRLLLGSVTQRVLSHTRLPVMVIRGDD